MFRSLSGSVATLLVGADEANFVIHEGLLSFSSDFFRVMFRGAGNYQEKKSLVVRLPEADKEAFHLFNQWLYAPAGQSPREQIKMFVPVHRGSKHFTHRTLELDECAKLFTLAEYLQCGALMSALRSVVCNAEETWGVLRNILNADLVRDIYDSFEAPSEFRSAAVKLCAQAIGASTLDNVKIEEYPPMFLWDVAKERDSKLSAKTMQVAELDQTVNTLQSKLNRRGRCGWRE